MSDEKPPGKGKKKNIEIHVGQGLQGLGQLLAGLSGADQDHDGKHEPLFFLRDHPQIEEIVKAHRERRTFLVKEHEAIQKKLEQNHEDLWNEIEDYMRANGLWPKGFAPDADLCLQRQNGVMYLHRHE